MRSERSAEIGFRSAPGPFAWASFAVNCDALETPGRIHQQQDLLAEKAVLSVTRPQGN
jgi:hypothetical protein